MSTLSVYTYVVPMIQGRHSQISQLQGEQPKLPNDNANQLIVSSSSSSLY